MSDTPRTDKAEAFADDGRMVSASFARTLERELAEANCNADAMAERWAAASDRAASFQRERDEARACLREACACVSGETMMPEDDATMLRWRKAAGLDTGDTK